MTELDSDEGRPFTPLEIAEMRQMLEREKSCLVWSTARIWATWIAAIGTAYVITKAFSRSFTRTVEMKLVWANASGALVSFVVVYLTVLLFQDHPSYCIPGTTNH